MFSNIIATEKKSYQRQFQALCNQFIKKANASLFLKKHTKLVDALLIKLWMNNYVYKKYLIRFKYSKCVSFCDVLCRLYNVITFLKLIDLNASVFLLV